MFDFWQHLSQSRSHNAVKWLKCVHPKDSERKLARSHFCNICSLEIKIKFCMSSPPRPSPRPRATTHFHSECRSTNIGQACGQAIDFVAVGRNGVAHSEIRRFWHASFGLKTLLLDKHLHSFYSTYGPSIRREMKNSKSEMPNPTAQTQVA